MDRNHRTDQLGPGEQARTAARVRRMTRNGAAPGRSRCPAAQNSQCASSPSLRMTVITGMSPTGMSRTTRSATWFRSATTPVPSRPARVTPASRTSNMPNHTIRAAGPAAATPEHVVENVIELNNLPAGTSGSRNPAGINGRHQAAEFIPKPLTDTRCNRQGMPGRTPTVVISGRPSTSPAKIVPSRPAVAVPAGNRARPPTVPGEVPGCRLREEPVMATEAYGRHPRN
jgi:hypothetical protein